MTQEPLSSCLIVTTYKKQVDKRKLVEAASFVSKINIAFLLKNRYFPQKVYQKCCAAKRTQTLNQKCSSVEILWYIDIL